MGSLHPSLSQTPTTSGNFCQDTAYSLGWSTPTGVTCLALAAVEADVIFFPSLISSSGSFGAPFL